MKKTNHVVFLAILAVMVGVFRRPLWFLATLSSQKDEYSHILLIPLISIALIYWCRTKVFAQSVFPNYPAATLLLGGLGLYGLAAHFGGTSFQPDAPFSLSILGFVLACIGAFVFTYGWSAMRESLFPLGFLLFAVPLPEMALAKIIYWLQVGSSDVAAFFLRTAGVPFFREGLIFQLPGITIEVAPECSGIRSSVALLITTLLAAQFLLRSNWRKSTLCILVFPLAMVKNGLRIATLSVLSVYVSRDFLYGWLHRSGGVVFFLIGFALICLSLRILHFGDRPFTLAKPARVSPSPARV